MHPHEALITRFYEAFRDLDGERMAACYHKEAIFRDPVFPDLRGDDVGRMWRMLASSARDFRLTFRDVRADDATGAAHWEAEYAFARDRRVHNIIEARFEFRNGLIARHEDSFDFWRWSRMALGPTGVLLGWTPLLQRKVQQDAARRLAKFQ